MRSDYAGLKPWSVTCIEAVWRFASYVAIFPPERWTRRILEFQHDSTTETRATSLHLGNSRQKYSVWKGIGNWNIGCWWSGILYFSRCMIDDRQILNSLCLRPKGAAFGPASFDFDFYLCVCATMDCVRRLLRSIVGPLDLDWTLPWHECLHHWHEFFKRALSWPQNVLTLRGRCECNHTQIGSCSKHIVLDESIRGVYFVRTKLMNVKRMVTVYERGSNAENWWRVHRSSRLKDLACSFAEHFVSSCCVEKFSHWLGSESESEYTSQRVWRGQHGKRCKCTPFVLYGIALHCIVLHCIALHCIVLYCIVLYCIVLCCRWFSRRSSAFVQWYSLHRKFSIMLEQNAFSDAGEESTGSTTIWLQAHCKHPFVV